MWLNVVSEEKPPEDTNQKERSEIQRQDGNKRYALEAVRRADLSRAKQRLTSHGVAPPTQPSENCLEDKFPKSLRSVPPTSDKIYAELQFIKSLYDNSKQVQQMWRRRAQPGAPFWVANCQYHKVQNRVMEFLGGTRLEPSPSTPPPVRFPSDAAQVIVSPVTDVSPNDAAAYLIQPEQNVMSKSAPMRIPSYTAPSRLPPKTTASGTRVPPTKGARCESVPGTQNTDIPTAPTTAVPPSDDVIPRIGAVASNSTVIPRASAVTPMTTVIPRESAVTSMTTTTVIPRESAVTSRTTVNPRESAVTSMATPTAAVDKIVYNEQFYRKPKSRRNKRSKLPPRDSFQHPHLTANTTNHSFTSRIVQNVILHGMACAASTTYNLPREQNHTRVPHDEEMCDEPDPSLHDDLNTPTMLRLRSVQPHKVTKRLTERKLQEIQAKAWSVTVTKNDVIAAALRMRQGVAAGPDQVAPWLLRIAVEANHDQLIASMAASLFNKPGRGEFSAETGAIFCAGDGVGLFKTAKKKLSNQRPIVSSLSLRRWMCRAQAVNIRETLYPKVADHQLGVAPGGTQVAAHAMRHLRARCISQKKWIIALIDFKNAFNSFSRDLMLRQCAAHALALLPVVQ